MPSRVLAIVAALCAGDYLLWTWSVSAGQDAMALIAGFTLPALIIALLWLTIRDAVRGLRRIATGASSAAPDRRPPNALDISGDAQRPDVATLAADHPQRAVAGNLATDHPQRAAAGNLAADHPQRAAAGNLAADHPQPPADTPPSSPRLAA